MFQVFSNRTLSLLQQYVGRSIAFSSLFRNNNRCSLLVICDSHLYTCHHYHHHNFNVIGKLDRKNSLRRSFCSSFFRNPKKVESYFSAIGGESDDPPPDLTPEQVTTILRTNESLLLNIKLVPEKESFLKNFIDILLRKSHQKSAASNKISKGREKRKIASSRSSEAYTIIDNQWVTQIESNQLASNHPIEDRLRISSLNLDVLFQKNKSSQIEAISSKEQQSDSSSFSDQCVIFGVFDGHGGGFCADIIARRLFHYVAVALKIFEIRRVGSISSSSLKLSKEVLDKIANNHVISPQKFYHNIFTMYEENVAQRLLTRIEEFELESLEKFAQSELARSSFHSKETISEALNRAFVQCDQDLSREIEVNLNNTSSNVLLHYYLSLAVSGCCAILALIYNDRLYVLSTGDCRAVMGLVTQTQMPASPELMKKHIRTIELNVEHNADNVQELNRIYDEHPKNERQFVIRENRLLGQLMPLRSFGDFSFKWSTEKMKNLGLTKAFGSHVIPSFYQTPPYLTAEPEINEIDLQDNLKYQESSESRLDRFLVLGTDGLWEQFDSSRKVVQAVNRYRRDLYAQIQAYTSAQVFKTSEQEDEHRSMTSTLTLGEIFDRLKEQIHRPPKSTFERVTADDDLIEDINCGTFLLRTALSAIDENLLMARPNYGRVPNTNTDAKTNEEEKFSHHVDQHEQQRKRHSKLVSYLTLSSSVVRNFRDDISLIVVGLK